MGSLGDNTVDLFWEVLGSNIGLNTGYFEVSNVYLQS